MKKIGDVSSKFLKNIISNEYLELVISNWGIILPKNISTCSYPEKIKFDVLTVSVLNTSVIEFSYYSDYVVHLVNQLLGKNIIQTICIKQFKKINSDSINIDKNLQIYKSDFLNLRDKILIEIEKTENFSVKTSLINLLNSIIS